MTNGLSPLVVVPLQNRYVISTGKVDWAVTTTTRFSERVSSLTKPSFRRRPKDLFGQGTALISSRATFECVSPLVETIPDTTDYRRMLEVFTYHRSFASWWTPGTFYNFPSGSAPGNGYIATKVLLDIKAQRSNLAVSLAELGKTSELLSGIAFSLVRLVTDLRRMRLRAATSRKLSNLSITFRDLKRLVSTLVRSKRIERSWLSFVYGLQPLASDVSTIIDMMDRQVSDGYIKGTSRHRLRTTTVSTPSGTSPLRSTALIRDLSYRAAWRFKVDRRGLKTASELGFTNPASLAWELVPFSFVVDWFVNVGDYLSTLDSLVGVRDLGVIFSLRETAVAEVTFKFRSHSFKPGSPGLTRVTTDYRQRMATTSSVPSPTISYRPHGSVRRLVNAIALLRVIHK